MKLLIDRRILASFRRRCLAAYPKEHIEAVYGRKIEGGFEVHSFGPIEYKATPRQLDYDDEEMDLARSEAREAKLSLIGSVHTHPNCYSAEPSEHDWIEGTHDGELVMGIVSISKTDSGRLRSRVKWWQPLLPLEMETR